MNHRNRERHPLEGDIPTSAPLHFPETLLTAVVGSLPNGQKVKPILVCIEYDGDQILLIEHRFSSIIASGSTFSEAVEDFKRLFLDELAELSKDEEQLALRLQEELQFLRSHIIEENS